MHLAWTSKVLINGETALGYCPKEVKAAEFVLS
jgi:hypothetical protein